MSYYEFINLIIDDVPIESIKNPTESMKQELEMNRVKFNNGVELPGPGFVGSNTNRPSINYFEF